MFVHSQSTASPLNDGELLDKYRASEDIEVLGVLYHRYMHLVYGVCLRYLKDSEESKDAVMEIFEKLIATVNKQEIDNFKSWLFVVTKNYCLMSLRKQRKTQNLQENARAIMEIVEEPHPNGEANEAQVAKALLNLPEHQKKCIELFYYQNLSYQEIARETGYELKKVKSYIQNGKRNLKGLINRE